MTPTLARIRELHAQHLAGQDSRRDRNQAIRELAGAEVCPTCCGHGAMGEHPDDIELCLDCDGTGKPPTQAQIAHALGLSVEEVERIVAGDQLDKMVRLRDIYESLRQWECSDPDYVDNDVMSWVERELGS